MSSELDAVDNAGSKDGVRQERVSGCLENLIKAKAFVHFLKTGTAVSRGFRQNNTWWNHIMRYLWNT